MKVYISLPAIQDNIEMKDFKKKDIILLQTYETMKRLNAESVHLMKFSDTSSQYNTDEMTCPNRQIEPSMDSSDVAYNPIKGSNSSESKNATMLKYGGMALGAYALFKMFDD